MENISNKICLICRDKKNLPLTTKSSQTTRDSRAVQIQKKEVMTTLPCGHDFRLACIKMRPNKRPRRPIDRRSITNTPFCSVSMRKELLRSVNEGRIDNLREILPAGFNPGQRSLTEKQWEISAELIKAGATIKNKIAQHQLRWMRQNGLGVELSYAMALTWYRKAAEQGNAFAQNQLGWMHQNGLVVEQNYAEALTWYRKAADQSHAFAQNQLGCMHLNGLGVEQNYADALTWYRKAADQGHAAAQNQVGYMHQRGMGVEQNYPEALVWYRKAADQGYDVFAQNELGWMYFYGIGGVEEDYAEALNWVRKAANQGHADAQNQLGWMYEKGMGVKQNYAEALIWYRKAADQGHADAQKKLDWMHDNGLGVEQNYAKDLILYPKAADQGHALPIQLAHVNGRRLKIVVCARQFMNIREIPQNSEQSNTGNDLTDRKVRKFIPCMSTESSILLRGYGDIASGVKGLELLQHEHPKAEMSFIVEHFAETENELRRIVEMSTLPNVKTIILDGRGHAWNHQQVRDEAIKTLNEATVIFHAQSGLIEPLLNSSGEYSKKTLAVSEYDCKSGCYSFKGNHGIIEKEIGFRGRCLYLTPSHRETTGFKNTTLERLFPTKDCTGKTPEDSNAPKKVLYFSYGHVLAAMNSMLRNTVIYESLLERDIVLVTSLKMRIEEIEQIVSEIYSTLHLTQPIKLLYEENGNQTARIIPKDADEQAAKTFNIVSMDCIEKDDFTLLEQYSTYNYTSGDISTTNVLGFGKIPFVDCKKKESNYYYLHEKLIQFANGASRAYKKSRISGLIAPEEIRNTTTERINLITHWENVCKSLSEHRNELPNDELKNLSRSLIALNSPAWLKFQGEFTDWLKSSHNVDKFILSRTREIIAESFSPSRKRRHSTDNSHGLSL